MSNQDHPNNFGSESIPTPAPPPRPSRRWTIPLLGCGLSAALLISACGGSGSGDPVSAPQPSAAQLTASGLDQLPVAPASERVDLEVGPFSDPTSVTNPLFPIKELRSAILNGRVDGKPFHTETTLLPYTRIIEWTPGERVEALVSQYSAFLDGRLEEVALDYYAQADDGAVWYFGEDVFNYNQDGVIADTDGTWLAGRDGPPAMIMPADPKVGDTHRPENIPGLVFEEVAVKTVDQALDGPSGPIAGGIIARELHDDGTYSDKQFAPGYGEFFSAHQGDVEAMALAIPTDAIEGSLPAALASISSGAGDAFEASRSGDQNAAAAAVKTVTEAWSSYRAEAQLPPRLEPPMSRAVAALAAAVDSGDPEQAGNAAIDVSQAALDFELRHRPPAEIDIARLGQWARQIEVDAAAGNSAGVSGDLATMEWVRDRFVDTVDGVELTRIDAHLNALRGAVVDEKLAAAGREAASLVDTLAGITPAG